jgi:hypothetical protein
MGRGVGADRIRAPQRAANAPRRQSRDA